MSGSSATDDYRPQITINTRRESKKKKGDDILAGEIATTKMDCHRTGVIHGREVGPAASTNKRSGVSANQTKATSPFSSSDVHCVREDSSHRNRTENKLLWHCQTSDMSKARGTHTAEDRLFACWWPPPPENRTNTGQFVAIDTFLHVHRLTASFGCFFADICTTFGL